MKDIHCNYASRLHKPTKTVNSINNLQCIYKMLWASPLICRINIRRWRHSIIWAYVIIIRAILISLSFSIPESTRSRTKVTPTYYLVGSVERKDLSFWAICKIYSIIPFDNLITSVLSKHSNRTSIIVTKKMPKRVTANLFGIQFSIRHLQRSNILWIASSQ
jgi:hypothetical protein